MLFAAITLFLASFLLSLVGTYLARRFARRLGLMDAPGDRKVHTSPTPRNGGIGIFWGFTLPLLVSIAALLLVEIQHLPDTGNLSATFLKFELPEFIARQV